MNEEPRDRLEESWIANADAWTDAVRGQKIPSRRLGTDAAVVAACERVIVGRERARACVLDVGCGEGWLSRELASRGANVLGIDASAPLIERAREKSADVRFKIVSYRELREDAHRVTGPFDVIVCNYSLLDDHTQADLSALTRRLSRDGVIVVQTLHPWSAAGDSPYEDGWRVETFGAFEQPFPEHMPWYFRTLGSWFTAIEAAGLRIAQLEEPLHPETRRPLSLLLTLERR